MSLFRFQHILGIGDQVTNFSGSLSNFFYGVDLESIEDVGFISLGVDDELDLLVPSNELGARLHLPASVVEVHVAACRLRRIVPLGIRPNGTIRLRGERPSSGSTRPFELSSGIFIMRKAVAAIRRRNTLSAVPLAIQKPAGQTNNPTCRRLQCFFVLTKGVTLIGPRPERPAFCAEFEKRIPGWHYRTMVTPGLSALVQVGGGYDLLPKEKVLLDLWESRSRVTAGDMALLAPVGWCFR